MALAKAVLWSLKEKQWGDEVNALCVCHSLVNGVGCVLR